MKEATLILTTLLLLASASAFEFCDDGTVGEDNLRIISVDDMLKENLQEWKWEANQNIELEIRVENKEDKADDYVLEAIFKDSERTIKIATDSDDLEKQFSLSANERKSISLEFEVDDDLDADPYDLYIKLYKDNSEDEECVENSEEKIEIVKIEICENDPVDSDELEITRIEDETEDNEEEWIWAPGNDIEISLDLENKDYSEREFEIELIFLNENNEEVSIVEDSGDLKDSTNLDEDESDEASFNFKIKSGAEEGKYLLYARAYDSDDEDICTSLKAESKSNPVLIKIEQEERKVIVTEVKGPDNTSTSSSSEFTATITNLGSQNEEKVRAVIYNLKLDIKEKIEINNLESGAEETVTFNVNIPENASIERHVLIFSTEYEYSESQDHYRSESDSDDDIKHYLRVYQGEKVEPEINETVSTQEEPNKNETEINETATPEEISENETEAPTTVITGNVIGTGEGPNWTLIIILLILAAIGITFFLKKSKRKPKETIESPKVTRRYRAKL